MSSLIVSGISPFLDFAGVLMFVEKISMYFLVGATLYFSRITKQDDKHNSELSRMLANANARDIKHNADLSAITLNENLAIATELADYREKFTARLDEIERVLQTHNNSDESDQ